MSTLYSKKNPKSQLVALYEERTRKMSIRLRALGLQEGEENPEIISEFNRRLKLLEQKYALAKLGLADFKSVNGGAWHYHQFKSELEWLWQEIDFLYGNRQSEIAK